jgi:hypothetical protein
LIKSFRGLLLDGEEEKIRLSTKKGKIGYRIVKFEIMPQNPGTTDFEHTIKLFKISQASVTEEIDFSDGNLLAVSYTEGNNSSNYIGQPLVSIFDREIFNQDIYITLFDAKGALSCNYYLELETINMTDNAAAVSTLRDIRLNPQVGA